MYQYPSYYFFNDFNQFESVFSRIKIKRAYFSKGEFLIYPSEMLDNCYYIVKGMVKLTFFTDTGSERTICFFGSGSIIPLILSNLQFTLEPHLTATAISEVEVITLSSKSLIGLVREFSDFALAAFDHYERFINLLLVRNLLATEVDSFSKVSSYLMLYFMVFPSPDYNIRISQEEIASTVGLKRVQVARVLSRLRSEQILTTTRNKIHILDFSKLKKYCSSFIDS